MSNDTIKDFLFPFSKRIDVPLFLYRHQDNEDMELRPSVIESRLSLSSSYVSKLGPKFEAFNLVDISTEDFEEQNRNARVYSLTDKGEELAEELDRLMRVIDEVEE